MIISYHHRLMTKNISKEGGVIDLFSGMMGEPVNADGL